MPDFKDSYQNEERAKEASRRARLQKIGMLSEDEDAAPRQTPSAAQPVRRPVPPTGGAGQRPVNPAGRPVAPVQRPAAPTQRPARTAQPYGQVEMSPQQRAAMAASAGAPQDSGVSRPQTPAQQRPIQQRPVQQGQRVPQQGQARPAQRPPQQGRPAQGAPSSRPRQAEDDMFSRKLSEEDSRAAMFGLTGRPTAPEKGGDVDEFEMDLARKTQANGFRKRADDDNKPNRGAGIAVKAVTIFVSFLLAIVVIVYAFLAVVAYGPSPVFRDQLVLMAEQASATKWAPYLIMPASKVQEIIDASSATIEDAISLDDYTKQNNANTNTDTGDGKTDTPAPVEDKWANAKDGMIFETVNKSTFKAYVLLVKDASRVFVGTSTDDFDNATAGVDVFEAADRYGAVACINGGEFLDNGGHGSGYAPLGLTFSKGECVFNDYSVKTFMGITEDNELIVRESMTVDEAKALHIRDGVSFQTGNTLIEKKDNQIVMHYQDGNTGTSQRSCIGQAADGTMIMIVTDGRTASSPGATHNDMIKLMVEYGAVSAGMLDGGSSAMMFYRDWFNKYDADVSKLDQYQRRGLVNNYKAFTNPRKIPSFFMVEP